MSRSRTRSSEGQRRGSLAGGMVAVALLLGSACSGSSDVGVEAAQRRVASAEEAVAEANAALESAGRAFCAEARDYIIAIDRYGKAFNADAATVGDLKTLGADLGAPRESTAAAAQAVLDAHDAVNAANAEFAEAQAALAEAKAEAKASASGSPAKTGKPTPTLPPSEPSVPAASIERVKTAESDLAAASEGITDQTPISQATETFTSAAFALEVAWLNLFADAGCVTDERAKEAADALRAYTAALQTDLKTAGYLEGKVDGVYGPETVAAVEDLQAGAGLPVTGLVDRATRAALNAAVEQMGQTAATQELIEATAVQTTLKLAGYWPGPIDGTWTPELEQALEEFQKDLGVKPTGVVDAATLAALEDKLVEISTPPPAPATSSAPSPSAPSG
ncbi:MAG TPA: peptidoglycan-binding domain-containing protein [Actinomycetota bacterium]|nr:peptidoglycan-binding domain-containing protein [Actinomycetota bacterium]